MVHTTLLGGGCSALRAWPTRRGYTLASRTEMTQMKLLAATSIALSLFASGAAKNLEQG
jgi:hypothetical protein